MPTPHDTTVRVLPLNMLQESPHNARTTFDPTELQALADSIRAQGLLQPILARSLEFDDGGNKIEIVDGARRFRAAKLAELDAVPVFLRQITDAAEAEQIGLVSNLQRASLTPYDEACGIARLVNVHGLAPQQVAEQLGRSATSIYNALKLATGLTAPEALDALRAGQITAEVATLIARLPAPQQRVASNKLTLYGFRAEPMPYREAKEELSQMYASLAKVPLVIRMTAGLNGDAPPCAECPNNASNDDDPDQRAELCRDPECLQRKQHNHACSEQKRLVEHGAKIVKESPYDLARRVKAGTLIDLTRKLPEVDKRKPLVDVLGDQLKGAITVVEEDKVHIVMEPAQLQKHLATAGIEWQAPTRAPNPLDTREEQRALHDKWQDRVLHDLEINTRGGQLTHDDLLDIAAASCEGVYSTTYERLLSRLPDGHPFADSPIDDLRTWLASHAPADAARLILLAAVSETLDCLSTPAPGERPRVDDDDSEAPWLAACLARHGVDWEAIAVEVYAPAQAPADDAPRPAKKRKTKAKADADADEVPQP